MNRLFSIRRRRPNIVDLWAPVVNGVDGYRLKWAASFAGPFTTFLTSSNVGFLDEAGVNRSVIDPQPTGGTQVRIVFNPASYSIPDTSSFWLQLVHVINGVEQTPGAPTLVVPESMRYGIITIAGTAPAAPGLQLDLPGLVRDIRIDTAADLLVATEQGGPATTITAADGPTHYSMTGTQGSLYVTGVAAFSATFTPATTQAFPR